MVSRSLRKVIKESLMLIPYEQIILFGSQARGDSTKQSDFDLLIILKDVASMKEKICLSTRLRKYLASKMIDADVLVKDGEDINYLKYKPGSVVRNALLEGISL